MRLTAAYLGVFVLVIAVLSAAAYEAIASNYRSILAPALATPEAQAGLASALRPVLFAILSLDGALVLVVGAASYALARMALRPLVRAREREERFSADVAHELRTPLGAIATLAQAARGTAGGEARDALDAIARRSLEAGELVADLLTLARTSDAEALDREPLDLAIVVRAVIEDVRAAATWPRDIVVKTESAIVLGDERRLRQLVRNLVDNACRHATSRVTLTVSAKPMPAIVIEDDGPGVEPAMISRLFERFARGTESNGSGLGLALCRWIAEAHDGAIAFSGGSRFVVTLPAA